MAARVADVEAQALDALREAVQRLASGKATAARVERVGDVLTSGYDAILQGVMDELTREMAEWEIPTQAMQETVAAIRRARDHLRSDVDRLRREALDADDLSAALAKFASDGMALVDTGILAAERATSLAQAESVGIRHWLFDGPQDGRTRDFCAEHVGKSHTSEQLAALENDVGPQPASVYGGGWNCRHRWVPLDESELSQYPAWRG